MNLKMRTMIGVAAGVMCLASPALAQRFSTPEKPPEPAKEPEKKPDGQPAPAAPAPKPDDTHRVEGSGGRFELPLKLYNEKEDAGKAIQKAREEALKENRRVLIMWGENKCEFCAYLNELLNTDPQLKNLIETEYVMVKVDIGKFDKNLDLAHRYGTPVDDPGDPANGRPSFGAPALTVVDAKSDQMITRAGGNEMVHKPMQPPNLVFDPPFILNMLAGGRATPQVSNLLMAEAQAKAKGQSKRVLVYFHIWASDSCKAWDRFVKDPEAAAVLSKAFIVRKIDVERHVAGDSLIKRLKGSPAASPPWATVLNGDSKPIAEAGGGLSFDSTETAAAAKWLGDIAGPVFTTADRETLAKALDKAVQPPAKEEPKADISPAPAKPEPHSGVSLAEAGSDAISPRVSITRWLWLAGLGSFVVVVIILARIAKRGGERAAVEHGR